MVEHSLISHWRLENVQFNVDTKKETFFDARDMLNRNTGNLPIFEMPLVFDSKIFSRSSRKHWVKTSKYGIVASSMQVGLIELPQSVQLV